MPQIMEAKVNPSPLSDLDHGPSEEILPIPVRNVEDELAPLYLPAQDRPGCLIQRHGPAPAALLSNAFLLENLSSSPSSALYEAHSRGNTSFSTSAGQDFGPASTRFKHLYSHCLSGLLPLFFQSS